MKLYDCIVQLKGEIKDQIKKRGVTAAEIKVLTAIHDGDNVGVRDIEEMGSVNRSENEERSRLVDIYGPKTIDRIFGVTVQHIEADINGEIETAKPKTAKRVPVTLGSAL
jgi:hypothetical protein